MNHLLGTKFTISVSLRLHLCWLDLVPASRLFVSLYCPYAWIVDNVVLLWRPRSGLSLPCFKEINDLQLVKHTPGVVNEALGVKVDSAIKVLPGSNVPIGPP